MDLSKFYIEIDSNLAWRIFLVLSAFAVILTASDAAFATTGTIPTPDANDVVGQTLCRLVKNLTGGTARGIATIAIFSVGVGLFLGKLNWGIGAATAAGVGIIFAAPQLVAFLSGIEAAATCPIE